MINFKDEDEPQNETVRQTLERVARELGVFGTTPTNNITHSPQSPMQQPTALGSSPNYSATAANNWQIQPTTAAPQNSNTFGSTPQSNQPTGFAPSPAQTTEQTSEIGTNHNGQPSQIMQTIYHYLDNVYGQQNPQIPQTPQPTVQTENNVVNAVSGQPSSYFQNNNQQQLRMPAGSEQQITMPSYELQQKIQQPSTWDQVRNAANNFADITKTATVGYATGATLGNFDEGMGIATAAVTLNPNNYYLGKDATKQLQKELKQRHPYVYNGAEFVGAMTTPMHLVKGDNFKQKAFNAFTDTLNASAGYAENWNDFGTNLAVNGIANIIGLKAEQLPLWRASARPLAQFGKKIFKQGINSSADKMKNMYYKKDEDEEKYY